MSRPDPSLDRPAAPQDTPLRRARRGRNRALGLALLFLVVLFYAITIVKVGGGS